MLPSLNSLLRRHASDTTELLYLAVFFRMLDAIGIKDAFYPFRGAANASLLYLVTRCLLEFDLKWALDLGAGQTTLLLNALRRTRSFDCLSLDHDGQWAQQVQKQVAHPVLSAPLKGITVAGAATDFYDFDPGDAKYDLIIVDGPPGSRTRSRSGVISLFANNLAEDFIIIFDDTERPGEAQTWKLARNVLEQNGIKILKHKFIAAKEQRVIFTKKFGSIKFF
jgi:hypothetical protein